jgi:hypothetical protein
MRLRAAIWTAMSLLLGISGQGAIRACRTMDMLSAADAKTLDAGM